jgi:transcription antitermination factor NusG
MGQHWYALHAKPHKERQAEAILNTRGIKTYFPTVPAPRQRHRSAERAFFPSYLFAHADLDLVGLWSLHYVPGLRGVVMFGGVPARVDDSVIAALRERLARNDVVDVRGAMLEPGDRVKIASGPLADLEAIFERRLSAAGRVRVLIHLLRRWTTVEMDADALRKTRGMPRRDLVRAPGA